MPLKPTAELVTLDDMAPGLVDALIRTCPRTLIPPLSDRQIEINLELLKRELEIGRRPREPFQVGS